MESTSTDLQNKLAALTRSIGNVLLGKGEVVEFSVLTLLAGGHLLIEDVPGVGKTTLAQALARSIDGSFKRIQFTSDLLPSDILGVSVFYPDRSEFQFKKGPIFANVVLADEINRATPKTQSALLEAMNERRITMDMTSYKLASPFLVLATQNPVEYHGTFPLPESQLDRFLMRIKIGYPDPEEEKRILVEMRDTTVLDHLEPVICASEVMELSEQTKHVSMDESILDYIMQIIGATRDSAAVQVGVSPRGSLALYRAAQVYAYLQGREYCIPDDVKRVAIPTLSHRLILKKKYAHLMDLREESEAIIAELLDSVPVPI
jgi:MoxR-like ATPase